MTLIKKKNENVEDLSEFYSEYYKNLFYIEDIERMK